MDKTNGSYYEILNVSPHASDEDVREAFKILAKIYHPDRNPNNKKLSNTRFQRVCEAYENLKTREKRMRYDQHLSATRAAQNDNQPRQSWIMQLAGFFRETKDQT